MHGYARRNSVAGLASDTACRAAGQIGESGPPRSTDVRKGSRYGHRDWATTCPVIVRPSGDLPEPSHVIVEPVWEQTSRLGRPLIPVRVKRIRGLLRIGEPGGQRYGCRQLSRP